MEQLAIKYGLASIYKASDTIEALEEINGSDAEEPIEDWEIQDGGENALYLNLANSSFFINTSDSLSKVEIRSIDGKLIKSTDNTNQSSALEINTTYLPKATYLVKLFFLDKFPVAKRLIKHEAFGVCIK